jgi:hypothetical protein
MAMARMMTKGLAYHHESNDKVQELEERVEKLERLVSQLMRDKNPSFTDFKFLKEDKKKVEDERKEKRMRDAMMSRAMFSNIKR